MFNIYQEYSPGEIKHVLMSTELDVSGLRDAVIITCNVLGKMEFELMEMKKHIEYLHNREQEDADGR